MVGFHTPERPRAIVVKRGRRSSLLTRTSACLWPGCRAALAHDHTAPVCGCHVKASYNLSHDKRAAWLVLHLLVAAYPEAVDLCGVLHCTSSQLEVRLRYLRRRGHHIVGARRGYVYEPAVENGDRRHRGSRTVKA